MFILYLKGVSAFMVDINYILFLGFSVTADGNGYVESISAKFPDINIDKIGLGGLHPHHAKFLLGDYIDKSNADMVVIEWSTSAFRQFLSKDEYIRSLIYIINKVQSSGAIPVILDLLRRDVDYKDDWVTEFHTTLNSLHGVAYLNSYSAIDCGTISLDELLKDTVHPTEKGVRFYADFFAKMLESISFVKQDFLVPLQYSSVYLSRSFYSYIADNDHEDSRFSYERSGYSLDFIKIDENEYINISNDDEQLRFSGFSYLLGPTSGNFSLSIDDRDSKNVLAYDQFCYYTRVGAMIFSPNIFKNIIISQLPGVPDFTLLKGSKELGRRQGFLGSLFLVTENFENYCEFVDHKFSK